MKLLPALLLSVFIFFVGQASAEGAMESPQTIKHSATISAAVASCAPFSLTPMADAILDATYDKASENGQKDIWAEGSARFHEMRKEHGNTAACFTVLKAFATFFNISVNGVIYSGEDYVHEFGASRSIPNRF